MRVNRVIICKSCVNIFAADADRDAGLEIGPLARSTCMLVVRGASKRNALGIEFTRARIAGLRRRAYGIFVWAPLARETLGFGGLSMNRTPLIPSFSPSVCVLAKLGRKFFRP